MNPYISLTIGGTDFTDYVVSTERYEAICEPIGELSIILEPNAPSITTYAEVSLSENGTQVFTGYVQEVSKQRLPPEIVVECSDVLVRASDYWFTKRYTSHSESTTHWIERFLNIAGITDVGTSVSTDTQVYPGYSWKNMSSLDAIGTILEMTPYRLIAEADGSITIKEIRKIDEPDHTLTELISFERRLSDETIRNRIVVFGNGFVAQKSGSSEYLPNASTRWTAAGGNGVIYNWSTAQTLANDMYEHLKEPLDIKTILVEADPDYKIGQTFDLPQSEFRYSNDACLLTSSMITYKADEGYLAELTFDEKCHRFWGWDRVPIPPIPDIAYTLYCGTWGHGVYKSTDGGYNWSATGLTGKNVYDVEVVTENTVWAACADGVYKTTNGGSGWSKQSMGVPLEQDAGEEIVEADLYWVGVKVRASDVYCLAGESGYAGVWYYYSSNNGSSWDNIRLA